VIELNLVDELKIDYNIVKETIRLKRLYTNLSTYDVWKYEYNAVLDTAEKKLVFLDKAKFNLFLIRCN